MSVRVREFWTLTRLVALIVAATASIVWSTKPGPFEEFYAALLAKGMRPEMARLTLARKIATIVLIVWKRGACFDTQHLKPQTA
jgi:hypothetical protein